MHRYFLSVTHCVTQVMFILAALSPIILHQCRVEFAVSFLLNIVVDLPVARSCCSTLSASHQNLSIDIYRQYRFLVSQSPSFAK